MKREIKFRYFSTEHNEMIYDCGLLPNASNASYMSGEGHYVNPSKPGKRVLMEFTGLKDSNGKDVYEGDIVDLHPEIKDKIWHRKIEWDTGAFHSRAIHTEANHPLHFHKYGPDRNWVVIGNVYENPELLK